MDQEIKIMPCLDMQNGRVVKGVHFVDIQDAGDPVECARAYCETGADELALLDIKATVEGRATMLDIVKRVAEVTTVPFTVGGGISDVKSAELVLNAGANKVSTSSAAFRKPELVAEMVKELGAEKVTVAIDVDQMRLCLQAMKYILMVDGQLLVQMRSNGQSVLTVTAFRLFCRQAKREMACRPVMICR